MSLFCQAMKGNLFSDSLPCPKYKIAFLISSHRPSPLSLYEESDLGDFLSSGGGTVTGRGRTENLVLNLLVVAPVPNPGELLLAEP